jgi:hypothetical protein
LRTAVALELSPGLMWAAGRLGLRDLGNGLRPRQRLGVYLKELASCFPKFGKKGRLLRPGTGVWDLHDQPEHHQL